VQIFISNFLNFSERLLEISPVNSNFMIFYPFEAIILLMHYI